jgi:heme/copper-type cytochrome/quinol oxidase subunit 2
MEDFIAEAIFRLQLIGISLLFISVFVAGLVAFGYILFLMWKYRDREQHSLEFVLLQVALPRDNEIKIDATEQLFSSLHGIHHVVKGPNFA